MDKPAAVYVKHPTIDSGSEFRLDEVSGVLRLELGHSIRAISESPDDLRDLHLQDLPDGVEVKVMLEDLKFVRIMKKIHQSNKPMTLRVVWPDGVDFGMEWLVKKVGAPFRVGDFHVAWVTLALPEPKMGFG